MLEKIKKTLLIIAGLALLIFVFAPSAQKPSDGKKHIRYWSVSGVKEEFPLSVREFNSMQDSIVVDWTPLPFMEHEKKVLTAILSGDPPDVIGMISPVAGWSSRRALVMLDDVIIRDNFDSSKFFPALWQEVKFNSHVFALPSHSSSYAFFYNKDMFREAGLDPNKPPTTWEEVKSYSKKIAKRNELGYITKIGFIPHYGNVQTSILIAFQIGVNYFKEDRKTLNLANPELIKAVNWEVEFINDYGLSDLATFMAGFGYANLHGFNSGKVAMMVLDNSFVDQIERYAEKLNYGIASIPTFKNSETASMAGCWWLAIPRGAKYKNAAWEFMKFATSKDLQLSEAESMEEMLYPANRFAASDSSYISNVKGGEIFYSQMNFAYSPTIVPMAHGVFWREFSMARERVMHRVQSTEEALKQAEKVIQAELDKAIGYEEYVNTQMEYPKVQ